MLQALSIAHLKNATKFFHCLPRYSYKELVPGNADGKSPSISSPCKCHYAGSLIDGTEFDSSYKRGEPLTLAPNQVIKGWTEAMQLMKEGAKWEL